MTNEEFEQEVRRLNPGRDDIKIKFVGAMPVFEYSNRLGMPKLPKRTPDPSPPTE